MWKRLNSRILKNLHVHPNFGVKLSSSFRVRTLKAVLRYVQGVTEDRGLYFSCEILNVVSCFYIYMSFK